MDYLSNIQFGVKVHSEQTEIIDLQAMPPTLIEAVGPLLIWLLWLALAIRILT